MKYERIIQTLLLILCGYAVGAQAESKDSSGILHTDTVENEFIIPMIKGVKSVGVNLTPMLKQVLPFNRSNPTLSGPYFIQFRRIKKNGSIARTGLGWDLNPGQNEFDVPNINLRFGWEKRKDFYSRWTFNRGFDFVFMIGGFNVQQNDETVDGFIGVQGTWGLDYFVLPNLSLNLETALVVGIGVFNDFTTYFVPPISLNLNYWFLKMK